ncbi:hypothetical protein [Loigolactobacillus zhaoyuanensis]|uniref:Uncharacterized protein n=1 Tax=Loigolactobacillus zhaoyuanensis TaxID=2486017 RepID=A0ABW8UI63_9LACO|nr:hypothetical protein [Loigolactobacillus zhaoyuanensis]
MEKQKQPEMPFQRLSDQTISRNLTAFMVEFSKEQRSREREAKNKKSA